jgi:hypothetical protein
LINETEIFNSISRERLESYRLMSTDTIEDLARFYLQNIQLAEALYPALALLEITLRNRLSNAIEKNIKPDWLIKEVNTQSILFQDEHELLLNSYKKLIRPIYKQGQPIVRPLTKGKLIAELNFGFWVNLCESKYNPAIWMKKPIIFDEVFPYYDSFVAKKNPNAKRHKRINKVAQKLRPILKLRNRVFHHEPIFNHPNRLNNCYADMEELLFYMSIESSEYLISICRFSDCWNKSPYK